MGIPAQQIGQGPKTKLLWQISKQLERLIQVVGSAPATTTSTTTL